MFKVWLLAPTQRIFSSAISIILVGKCIYPLGMTGGRGESGAYTEVPRDSKIESHSVMCHLRDWAGVTGRAERIGQHTTSPVYIRRSLSGQSISGVREDDGHAQCGLYLLLFRALTNTFCMYSYVYNYNT